MSVTPMPSKAFSSEAKASPPPTLAVKRGLMPKGSRAATMRSLGREHEGEHAVEPRHPARRALAEEVQDGLAVGAGGEGVLPQDRAQILVVVDLAVGHQRGAGAGDRLGAVLEAR